MTTRPIEFEGLGATEIVAGGLRIVVVHQVGPRVAWLGVEGGDNLLFWDKGAEHGRGDWWLRGGHRLWVTRPMADETEESYAADNRPCRVQALEDGLSVTAPPDTSRLEKTLAVRVVDRGTVSVEHRVRNAGDMLWSGGAWALTCTRPGPETTYRVPFGEPTAWDVVTLVIPRRWGGGHTSAVADPQLELGEDALVLRPRGREAKRMISARPGRIEMTDPRGTFVKEARYERGAPYPLDTNLAVYVAPGNFMVEMETMSPVRVVPPGEDLVHTERWTVA
jgi:hypothetical protein